MRFCTCSSTHPTSNFSISMISPALFFMMAVDLMNANSFTASLICLSFKMVPIVDWESPDSCEMTTTGWAVILNFIYRVISLLFFTPAGHTDGQLADMMGCKTTISKSTGNTDTATFSLVTLRLTGRHGWLHAVTCHQDITSSG